MDHIHLTDATVRLIPWIIGLVVSVIAVAIRNEWTTNQMKSQLFDQNGDLRLMKTSDCENCRKTCQEAFEKAILVQIQHWDQSRIETRQDIQSLHKKMDDMPGRIIALLKDIKT
jgi:hypothetical protein